MRFIHIKTENIMINAQVILNVYNSINAIKFIAIFCWTNYQQSYCSTVVIT